MFRLTVIVCLGLLAPGLVTAFSDVNRDCIANNAGDTSNDFLLGTWYRIVEFISDSLISSRSCPVVTYTKPDEWQLRSYIREYQSAGLPFAIDENPILENLNGQFFTMLSGEKEAKFQVITPNTTSILNMDGYAVNVFRHINDNFVLTWECALRGNRRWLLTRDRNTPSEEIQRIIASIPDVQRMFPRRYCIV